MEKIKLFIEKSKNIHGDRYDYSLIKKYHSKLKLPIICFKHGVFNQYPYNHIKGRGCPSCGSKKYSNNDVITLFKQEHNNLYDYSKVDYINMNTKIEIICSKHGSFFQKPKDHIHRKHGCPKCGYSNVGGKLTTKDIIERSKNIFGDLFEYDKLIYINEEKFIITCKIHGDFETNLRNHIHQKTGCPNCIIRSKGEFYIFNYLTEKQIEFKYQYRFTNCINPKTKRKLPFDFYIPSINSVIEYHGKQHYENQPFFSNYGGFEGLKERDKIKKEFCIQNNISYIELNKKNINEIQKYIRFNNS